MKKRGKEEEDGRRRWKGEITLDLFWVAEALNCLAATAMAGAWGEGVSLRLENPNFSHKNPKFSSGIDSK